MIVVGRFWKTGQKGRFGKGEIVEGFVEIVQRRRRHPVGSEAEINFVKIQFENFVLRERAFNTKGENDFLGLSLDRHFVREQKILSDLLGYCRCPDWAPVAVYPFQVGDSGP